MKQLRQFIVLAQELNFSRAAQRLHISQPPLSVSIRKLEESVGAQLFVRQRPQLQLTAAGEEFLKHAIRIVAQYDSATEAARNMSAGIEGVLRIAFLPSAAFNFLPAIIKQFKSNHAKVQIIPSSNSSENIAQDIRYGKIDIGLVVRSHSYEKDLDSISAGFEKILLAVPAGHELATQKQVSIADLADECFISFPLMQDHGFANIVLTVCRAHNFYPNIIMESEQMHTILTLVASGIGIAFVPSTSMSIHTNGIQYLEIPVPDDMLSYELSFIFPANNTNQVVSAFIDEARNYVPGRAAHNVN